MRARRGGRLPPVNQGSGTRCRIHLPARPSFIRRIVRAYSGTGATSWRDHARVRPPRRHRMLWGARGAACWTGQMADTGHDERRDQSPFGARRGMPLAQRIRAADSYGLLLALIVASLIGTAAVGRSAAGPVAVVVLQGSVLIYAIWTSRAGRRPGCSEGSTPRQSRRSRGGAAPTRPRLRPERFPRRAPLAPIPGSSEAGVARPKAVGGWEFGRPCRTLLRHGLRLELLELLCGDLAIVAELGELGDLVG